MLVSTTAVLQDKRVTRYLGVVSGEAILGANIVRDFLAGIRDVVGGRSAAYEQELRKAKDLALGEMEEQAAGLGANAIIGVDLDYETLGNGTMLMVSASGTAVVVD
jgi:uncharacterized protein YbjQ (UPF0145 family)